MYTRLGKIEHPIAMASSFIMDYLILPSKDSQEFYSRIFLKNKKLAFRALYNAMIRIEFRNRIGDINDKLPYKLTIKQLDQMYMVAAMKKFLPQNFNRSEFFYKDEYNNLACHKIEEDDIAEFIMDRKDGIKKCKIIPGIGYDTAGNPQEGIYFILPTNGCSAFVPYKEFLFLYTIIASLDMTEITMLVIDHYNLLDKLDAESSGSTGRTYNIPDEVRRAAEKMDRRIDERG